MAQIERFVGIVGAFNAKPSPDPLRFTLTPKKGLKARLFYISNITCIRQPPHPRFNHPTTGTKSLRFSEALDLAKKLQGIPLGEKLTHQHKF